MTNCEALCTFTEIAHSGGLDLHNLLIHYSNTFIRIYDYPNYTDFIDNDTGEVLLTLDASNIPTYESDWAKSKSTDK